MYVYMLLVAFAYILNVAHLRKQAHNDKSVKTVKITQISHLN